MSRFRGLFISFEGGEATGKSAQAARLYNRLQQMSYRCFNLHEPGGTPLGDHLRPLIKGDVSLTPTTELFLFSAARAQLVYSRIEPELQQGAIVIVDRYVDSTTVYQGYGYEGARGRPTLDQIQAINSIATRDIIPDLTILLDMDPEQALPRRTPRLAIEADQGSQTVKPRLYEEGQSKFEIKNMAFHKKVREGYLKLARKDPERWLVVDARQPADDIEQLIWKRVQAAITNMESRQPLDTGRLI